MKKPKEQTPTSPAAVVGKSEQLDLSLMGNEAVAYGAKLARVPLCFFFPIGPSDEVMETMARFYTTGEMEGKVVQYENEEANAAGACAASALGIRTLSATNSEGMAKGFYVYRAAGWTRRSLVLAVANRSLEPPGGVLADWSDCMIYEDLGWIMIWCENGQEIVDVIPQAYKISETLQVPVIVAYEGWEVSHSTYRCRIPPQEDIDEFLPPYKLPPYVDLLSPQNDWRKQWSERTIGMDYSPQWFPEHRYVLAQAMQRARDLLRESDEWFGRRFGRKWGGVMSLERCEDAEVVFLTMGSMAGTARLAMEALREQGYPAGLAKLRLFSPFPRAEVIEGLGKVKAIVSLDRFEGLPLYRNLCSIFYSQERRPLLFGRVTGVGGAHPSIEELMDIGTRTFQAARGEATEPDVAWLLKGTIKDRGLRPHPA